MPVGDRPAAEVDVTVDLVRRLLAEQHPDLADRPLAMAGGGWDNVLVRMGDDLVARLPRRALAARLVVSEQRWLPDLAADLPVPVPVPLRAGRPGAGYPWPWSVCPWIAGTALLDLLPLPDGPAAGALAADLGRFLRALHRPAPAGAPANPYRGVPLIDRDPLVRERAAQLADVVDATAVLACWDRLLGTPPWPGPPVWLHGDVHAGNLVVRDGRLVGVVDFGDLTAGDPASDLSVAWIALPPSARPVLRAAAGDVDDATWARARAWALALGLAMLSGAAGDEAMAAMGRAAVAAAL